jgi:hypothetical protein
VRSDGEAGARSGGVVRKAKDVDREVRNPRVTKPITVWLASAVFLVGVWASHAVAHHPGGLPGAKMVVEGSQAGYKATLEVFPGEVTAGTPLEFFLWVTPEAMGPPHAGEARLWLQGDGLGSPAATTIPLTERDRGMASVVYSAAYRFDRAGTYRVTVELPSLSGRWEGAVAVEQTSPWFLGSWGLIAFAGLVGIFVVFLEWRQRRSERRR